MAISQLRSKKKVSGGRYKYRAKKKKNLGSLPTHTKLGKKRVKVVKGRAGFVKERLLQEEVANVYDPKSKKCLKLKIFSVVDNKANRHFVRRGILTKGAVIKTEKGDARITSKPGQERTINAVLISK